MKLTLQRLHFTDKSTQGIVSMDGPITWPTLELPDKDGLPGSCIPAGMYPVRFRPSPKFMRNPDQWVQRFASQMPHIEEIPKRSLIMFHWGNFPKDTDGCILVGQVALLDVIGGSRLAFEQFWNAIRDEVAADNCFVEVVGGAKVPSVEQSPASNAEAVQDAAAGEA